MTPQQWWHEVGSGMPPLPGEDASEHVRRVVEACWPEARAAIYEAEAAQLTAGLRRQRDELLEALKLLVKDLEDRSKNGVVACSDWIYRKAHGAITKATRQEGGAP